MLKDARSACIIANLFQTARKLCQRHWMAHYYFPTVMIPSLRTFTFCSLGIHWGVLWTSKSCPGFGARYCHNNFICLFFIVFRVKLPNQVIGRAWWHLRQDQEWNISKWNVLFWNKTLSCFVFMNVTCELNEHCLFLCTCDHHFSIYYFNTISSTSIYFRPVMAHAVVGI